jgi:hypothetical protein
MGRHLAAAGVAHPAPLGGGTPSKNYLGMLEPRDPRLLRYRLALMLGPGFVRSRSNLIPRTTNPNVGQMNARKFFSCPAEQQISLLLCLERTQNWADLHSGLPAASITKTLPEMNTGQICRVYTPIITNLGGCSRGNDAGEKHPHKRY